MEKKPFPDLAHNKVNCRIPAMRVASYKESWLSGSSEVSIRAKLVCHNGRALGVPGADQYEYTSDQYSNLLGKLIKKFKRKWVKDVALIQVDYSLQRDWQDEFPSQDPVYFIYTIFERDVWPAKKTKDDRWAPDSPISGETSPGSFKLWFRDSQTGLYARYWLSNTTMLATGANNWAGSGLVQNADIAFSTDFY